MELHITLNEKDLTNPDVRSLLANLGGSTAAPAQEAATIEAEPTSAKRKRRTETSATPEADRNPEPATKESTETETETESAESPKTDLEPEQSADDAQPAEVEEDIPSVVDLRAKAQEIGTSKERKQAIKDLLDEFECESLSKVPDEKRTAFMAALVKLGEGDE